jgi:hypothetical protein
MERYADIIENKMSWLDSGGKAHQFDRIHYVFSSPATLDAWKADLEDLLKGKYTATTG